MEPTHHRIYQQARCYDVAFGFRNVPAECDTLAALVQRHGVGAARSVLELAAGPARHAREFARRGVAASALDSSPAMAAFALSCAATEGVLLQALVGDMVDFKLPQPVDLAFLLMDSASYLLDNDVALRHLRCVARQLSPGGLYVLEMSHPRAVFGVASSTDTEWTQEADGLRVTTRWGAEEDVFDPVSQTEEVTVTMEWAGPEGSGQIVERARQRRFTANEFDALVRASGCFEVVELLGSLAPAVPFDNAEGAWRMVPVLRRS